MPVREDDRPPDSPPRPATPSCSPRPDVMRAEVLGSRPIGTMKRDRVSPVSPAPAGRWPEVADDARSNSPQRPFAGLTQAPIALGLRTADVARSARRLGTFPYAEPRAIERAARGKTSNWRGFWNARFSEIAVSPYFTYRVAKSAVVATPPLFARGCNILIATAQTWHLTTLTDHRPSFVTPPRDPQNGIFFRGQTPCAAH
jgi:hypothetical protein